MTQSSNNAERKPRGKGLLIGLPMAEGFKGRAKDYTKAAEKLGLMLLILALTVIVKLVMFPLANNAYASMSKMRNLHPKMEEIKKKLAESKP